MFKVTFSPPHHPPTDKELIQGLIGKDMNAYRKFIAKYYEFMLLITFAMFNDQDRAKEYVSDIMLQIWNAAPWMLREEDDLKGYLLDEIQRKYKRDRLKGTIS